MGPKFNFKDFVIIDSDVPFWSKIKGQIIDFEAHGQDSIRPTYKYLVKIKKSSITKWFEEDELSLRNSEVTKAILESRYE